MAEVMDAIPLLTVYPLGEGDGDEMMIATYVPEADVLSFGDALRLAEARDAAAAAELRAQFEE